MAQAFLSIHTVRKVKFLSKKNFNFDETLQFFSVNQSCQQLKSANPQHFHEIFTQNNFDNFSREIKVVNSKKVQNRSIFTGFSLKFFFDNFFS